MTRGRPRGSRAPGEASVAVAKAVTLAPAREAAYRILLRVERGGEHSDELLRAVDRLSRADRNLCTALVMGTLRWQIAIDALIRPLLARPEQRLAPEVLLALRLGVFQLRYMDRIPAHAALSESVELCRAAGQPHATGMVNAVLRKVAEMGRVQGGRALPLWETTAAFAERLGHPLWLVERWVAAYGRAAALAICEAGQHEAREGQMFALRSSREMPDAVGDDGKGGASESAKGLREVDGVLVEGEEPGWDAEDAESLPVTAEHGALLQMDDGSRLVAELAAAAMPGAARVWDCCAAPGGKTLVLLERLGRAEMLASDVSGRRLAQMKTRLARVLPAEARLRTRVVAAESLPAEEGGFDLVLCDVPCTGTGTLARNPEIRHRLAPRDLERQVERQRGLLATALSRVAPEGRLVYSTCSLEQEECDGVVDAVAGAWRRVPVAGLMESLRREGLLDERIAWQTMVARDALRTLPGVHPCDGFYAVVLER